METASYADVALALARTRIVPYHPLCWPMSFDFERRPSESPFVEAIWRTRSENAGRFISTAAAQWEMVLIRHEGQTEFVVRGPETRAAPANFPGDADYLGIVFRMGTYSPQLPPKELIDRRDAVLPQVARNHVRLHGTTLEIPTFENADAFINRLVCEDLLARDPVVTAALEGRADAFSVRSAQRRFQHVTGLTHKLIRQIERAQQAVALLEQGVSILDVVFEVGYYDQSHMTAALKRFMGRTPGQFVRAD